MLWTVNYNDCLHVCSNSCFEDRHIFVVFVIVYATGVIATVFSSVSLVLASRSEQEYELRRNMLAFALGTYGMAFLIWSLEMGHCEVLRPYYDQLYGLTLHIIWHLGAGFGTYVLLAFINICRCQSLGYIVEIDYLWCFPIVKINGREKLLQH